MIALIIIFGILLLGGVAYLFGVVLDLKRKILQMESKKSQMENSTFWDQNDPNITPTVSPRYVSNENYFSSGSQPSAKMVEIEKEMDQINNQLSGFEGEQLIRGNHRVILEEKYQALLHDFVTEITKETSDNSLTA